MFKKVLSTAIGLSLAAGISCNSSSASLPIFLPSRVVIEKKLPGSDTNTGSVQNFLNNYNTMIDIPHHQLLLQFEKNYVFINSDEVSGFINEWIYNNPQVNSLINRINLLKRNRINPIKDIVMSIVSGVDMFPINLPSQNELEQIYTEINNLLSEIENSPSNKPTDKDINAGKCIELCRFSSSIT